MAKPDPFGWKHRDINVRIAEEYEWARLAGDHDLAAIQQAEREKAEAEKEKAIAAATPTDEEIVDRHTALIRAKRTRPEILAAVIAVRGHNNPADHPYTVAGQLLAKVNAWLDSRGHKPVLIKALASRIPHT
jgi:hypothetical protein